MTTTNEWLQKMADLYGVSLSDLLKKYSIEQLEDEYDAKVGEAAYKHYQEAGEPLKTIEQVMEELLKPNNAQ
ncbi:type II toxin-antitoxin system RelB family antitoxin [Xylocopilactobacillus apicola]|uniref:Antitoxin n=1 Tax=Xylocopilactobacillus apicola TaxID=2932184 RepID=A0AAU9D2L3_9LACO|nr:DUF6290 family protein [Xylocopilactobacillus apicola]BDR57703.1 hypothetical protein XA3_01440 [Xylocopilactobacillus apicola]